MNIKHKEYLENILQSNKIELRELEIKLRIYLAENTAAREMLQRQIYSIEKQLENGDE